MPNRVQTLRSSVAGNRPTGRLPGELYVNWPDLQLGVINSAAASQDLIAVRYFSASTSYNIGDYVANGGQLYRANTAVVPGAFNPAQWDAIATQPFVNTHPGSTTADTAPASATNGTLWWDSVGGQLYVRYGTTWVIAVNSSPPPAVVASATPPAGPLKGQMWFDTNGAQTYVWNGAWVIAVNPPLPNTANFAPANAIDNIGRNLIHNGLFRVQQRGAGPWSASGFSVDRWYWTVTTDTSSLQIVALTDADRAAIGDETAAFGAQATVAGSSASGATSGITQTMEGVRRLANKTVIVSFWAKASAALKIYVDGWQAFGSGGSAAVAFSGGTTVNVTTTWARYSVVLNVGSAAGKTFGTAGTDGNACRLQFSYGTGMPQSGTFTVWGVQLEIAQPQQTQPTPLEYPDPRYELSNCQRFYQTFELTPYGYNGTTGGLYFSYVLPVTMRASPTVTVGALTSSQNCTAIVVNYAQAGSINLNTQNSAVGGSGANITPQISADL